MTSVTVSPGSCRMALVTNSLVSRTATSSSTGTSQAQMAARTWPRASATTAGPDLSRTRHPFSSGGRVGAMAFIGFLRGRFELVRETPATVRGGCREVRARY